MKETLITLLKTFGYPVMLQGSLAANQKYPDSFFTFWNNDSYDGNHYDNKEISWIWSFDVNFYSTNPVLVNTMLLQTKNLLRSHGFIISGKGYDVASDEPTHTGRGINALYKENNIGG